MIATIIDIVSSKDINAHERKKLDKKIRDILCQTHTRFREYCLAIPTLTQGDSIELLVTSWQPIVFLLHRLLMEELKFRVGLGTGTAIIQKEVADECDGSVFWNARNAIDEIKKMKYMSISLGFIIDDKTSSDERNAVTNSVLLYTSLLSLTTAQLEYCFYYIWEKKQISEISEVTRTSKGNISKTLSKTPCYLLERVMAFLNEM
ncbi:MAG: hypothetical protein JW779_06840 [Candidatus Thorarchaeota archaeon]|nr:hypothetical protein [Candidatus Thorarchaeota archaeon]